MREAGFTQAELADAVNAHLWSAGHEGTVSDRTVRHWLTRRTRWPQPRQRQALEAVFGCGAVELGFTPPTSRHSPTTTPEQTVRRRHFLAATTGTTAAVILPATDVRPHAVGASDVHRLRDGLDELDALDAHRGGHDELERAALAGAHRALEMQKLPTTQRIRHRLFSVAASYTETAAWSALDARQPERAQRHLDRALYLAGLAQDDVAEFQVWNAYAMLARQQGDYEEAVGAAQAAQRLGVARRDPFFASLAHARTAIGHAYLGERQVALRSLGWAEEALDKASPQEPRPSWVAFYGEGELSALTAIVRRCVGDYAEAEAASHQALAAIPERFRRNRAMVTTDVAWAQLHQGEVEQACATAATVFDSMAGAPLPGRLRSLLGDFHRDLITLAPRHPVTRDWGDRYRAEWSRA